MENWLWKILQTGGKTNYVIMGMIVMMDDTVLYSEKFDAAL
jgi:hypothetical protein